MDLSPVTVTCIVYGSFPTIYLLGALWLFLSVFVTSQHDVVQNDDGICKITSPGFCFLLHLGNTFVYMKNIKTDKMPRCSVAFVDRGIPQLQA